MSGEKADPAESSDEPSGETPMAPDEAAKEAAAEPKPEPGEAAEEDAGAPPPVDEQARLRAEVSDLKDQVLRALAETENLRKRSERALEDAAKYGITEFAREIVGVADNLRRALESLPAKTDEADDMTVKLAEGVEATQRQLDAVFERHGIVRIDPAGEPFDHNLHQAMFEIEDSGQPPGTVVQVVQHGYKIRDRLLRPAMVGVAKKPQEGPRVDTEA